MSGNRKPISKTCILTIQLLCNDQIICLTLLLVPFANILVQTQNVESIVPPTLISSLSSFLPLNMV